MHNLVPHFILDRYSAGERIGRFPAAALFVDISGFSALTDALMEQGQHGAEILATAIQSLFEPLVRCVFAQDGFVASFAGDAFTAVFSNTPSGNEAAVHAFAAAWQMQAEMRALGAVATKYGTFSLSVKVGVAAGEVAWGIVSAEDGSRASYYFRGSAVDGCAEAEHQCRPGEIMVDAAVFQAIRGLAEGEPVADFFRVTAVSGILPHARPIRRPRADAIILTRFFPATLIHQSHPSEFRQVVNLFISLPTVRTESQLDIFMQSLFSLQEQYGGLLNRLDFGDKGSHLLMFWGAPIAHENDVERVLNFILDLQSQTSIPINAGIAYQTGFVGLSGSKLHQEYTSFGRGVNLAARFMTGAPRGEIWVDENVARLASFRFEIDFEGESSFKGFARPQKVFVLLERKELVEPRFQGELIGREAELTALEEFVRPIYEGRNAGTLVVWGEPGIGKSRLLYEFQASVELQERDFLWAFCQADEILRQSLNPFRYWLRHYFNQSVEQSDARNKRSFNRKMDGLIEALDGHELALELDRIRSFLGALVSLSWPDSLYEQVEGQARYDNTFAALIVLLTAESRRRPVLLLIEDAHWLDDDSKAFLPKFVREVEKGKPDYPIAILATARFEGSGLPLGEALRGQEIDLGGLNREDLERLAISILDSPVEGAVLDLVDERAEGNPFFGEQIVLYLREMDWLSLRDGRWVLAGARDKSLLPADVRAVLVARLDRLTQAVKEVVQTASILGREFEIRVLAKMSGGDERIEQDVRLAEQSAIWSALTEIRYIFRHALLRDTVYRMQARQRRQGLHALAFAALESLYGADLRPYFGELAYHALQADLCDQAFRYGIAAGDKAMREMALSEAISHFENAQELLLQDRLKDVESTAIQNLYLQFGRTLELNRQFDRALDLYRELRNLGEQRDDEKLELASLTAQCIVRATQTPLFDVAQARALAEKALDLAKRLGDKATEAKVLWGMLLTEVGGSVDLHKALDFGLRSLELARELDLREQMGFTYLNLASVYTNLGQLEAARKGHRAALEIWQELGNVSMQADAYTMLHLDHYLIGDIAESLALAEAGLRLSRSIGNLWSQTVSLGFSSIVLTEFGETGRAAAMISERGRINEAVGDGFHPTFHYLVHYHWLELFLSLGVMEDVTRLADELFENRHSFFPHFAELMMSSVVKAKVALRRLDQAQQIWDEIKALLLSDAATLTVGQLQIAQLHLLMAQKNWQHASETADEIVKRTRDLGGLVYLPEQLWLLGNVQMKQNEWEPAYETLSEGLTISSSNGERRLRWRILSGLADVADVLGRPDQAEMYRTQGRETVDYIADHIGDERLRAAFLATPDVRRLAPTESISP